MIIIIGWTFGLWHGLANPECICPIQSFSIQCAVFFCKLNFPVYFYSFDFFSMPLFDTAYTSYRLHLHVTKIKQFNIGRRRLFVEQQIPKFPDDLWLTKSKFETIVCWLAHAVSIMTILMALVHLVEIVAKVDFDKWKPIHFEAYTFWVHSI